MQPSQLRGVYCETISIPCQHYIRPMLMTIVCEMAGFQTGERSLKELWR